MQKRYSWYMFISGSLLAWKLLKKCVPADDGIAKFLARFVMEHPVQYVERLTRFLDRLIEQHGDYLFAVFVFICLGVLLYVLTRRRKHPVYDIPVTILPVGQPTKRKPEEQDSPPFEEHPSL